MSDNKVTKNTILQNIFDMVTAEGFQKYVLGTKKNGQPRAIYDVVKDYRKPAKKKNKDKKSNSVYTFYLDSKGVGNKKKKKKKKNKESKHWHI